jgi:phosphopantetheinyl transferase
MPLFKTIPISGGLIGIWKFTESTTDLLPAFTAEELADPTFLKYTHEKRKVEWLTTRALIRQLIDADFTISYQESGKPILKHTRYRHISISHSRDFAAVILHENLSVGIDIESATRDFIRVENRFLSDQERAKTNRDPQLQCLFWCAKEAIFKLVDNEGIDFKQQIQISANAEKTRFSGKFLSGEKESDYQLYYDFFAGNCLVWVIGNL